MIQILLLRLGLVLGDITYMEFSNASNPNQNTIQLITDNTFFGDATTDYTLEFWMYPVYTSTAVMQIVDVNPSFGIKTASLSVNELQITDNSQPDRILFTVQNVNNKEWRHITITVNQTTATMRAYRDTRVAQVITGETPTFTNNPDYIYLGDSFGGKIREIRYWKAERSQSDLEKFYVRYYTSPYPSELHSYWRLINPEDPSQYKDYIRDITFAIDSSQFEINQLWQFSFENEFICATDNYIDEGCQPCVQNCQECSGSGLTNCSLSDPVYLYRGAAPTWLVLVPSIATPPITIEFMFKTLTWDATDQNMMYIDPALKILRDAQSNRIKFTDINDEVLFTYEFSLNRWIHLAVTININGDIQVYGDGGLLWNGNANQEFTTDVKITIGQFENSPDSQNYKGYFQELRAWSGIRTASQINNYQNTRMQAGYFPADELVSVWPLTDGDNTLFDIITTSSVINNNLPQMWQALNCQTTNCLLLCNLGSYRTSNDCQICASECAICDSPSSGSCLECANTAPYFVLGSSVCYENCPNGYFKVEGQFRCVTSCPSKTFQSADGSCNQCNNICAECEVSDSNCTQCDSGSLLHDSTCKTACPTGTYEVSGTCLNCASNCDFCSGGLASQCSACNPNYPYVVWDTQVCVNECPAGYKTRPDLFQCVDSCPSVGYHDVNDRCIECNEVCNTCFGPNSTQCESCPTNYLFYNDQNTCVLTCPQYSYQSGNTCSDCAISWATCDGSGISDCTTCKPEFPYRDQTTNECLTACKPSQKFQEDSDLCVETCPYNYWTDVDNCRPCNFSCRECSGDGATQCTSCQVDKVLNTLNAQSQTGECINSCPEGTYQLGVTCFTCSDNCQTCSACSTCDQGKTCIECKPDFPYKVEGEDTCLSICTINTFLIESENLCVNQCPSDQFPETKVIDDLPVLVCSQCDLGCVECAGPTETDCIKCPPELFLLDGSCVLQCDSNYYIDEDKRCFQCSATCATCSGVQAADCLSCIPAAPYQVKDTGECVAACPGGLYLYSLESQCLSLSDCSAGRYIFGSECFDCSLSCATCNGPLAEQCLTCSGDLNFFQSQCIATCPVGYYGSGNVCRACTTECARCTGPTLLECQQCTDNKLLYTDAQLGTLCIEICPDRTYIEDFKCKPCGAFCEVCGIGGCTQCEPDLYTSAFGGADCVDTCPPSAITSEASQACAVPVSLNPSGDINVQNLEQIIATWPVEIKKGLGTLSIESIEVAGDQVYPTTILQYNINNPDVSIVDSTLTLTIDRSAFKFDKRYRVVLPDSFLLSTANEPLIGWNSWEFSTSLYELSDLYVSINNGIKGQETRITERIVLDASGSYDPSANFRDGDLSYEWTCQTYTDSYAQYEKNVPSGYWADYIVDYAKPDDPLQTPCALWDYGVEFNTTFLSLDWTTQVQDVYRFEFTMSDQGNRTDTTEIYIIIVSETEPRVTIDNLPILRVNTDKPLQLSVDASYEQDSLEWTSDKAITVLTPLIGSRYLTIEENTLLPGYTYQISIEYKTKGSTSQTIQLEANLPPLGGNFDMTESNAFGVIGKISGKLMQWEDNDLPLSYQFSWMNSSYVAYNNDQLGSGGVDIGEYPVTGKQASNELDSMFPIGQLNLIGYIYDSLGQSAITTSFATLTPQLDPYRVQDRVSAATSNSDPFEALHNIASICLVYNYTRFEDEEIITENKGTFLSKIEDIIKIADSEYEKLNTQYAAEIYSSVVTTLETVSREVLNLTVARQLENVMQQIDAYRFDVKIKVQLYEGGETVTSTQDYFTTRHYVNLGQMMLKTVQNLLGQSYTYNILTGISYYFDQSAVLLGQSLQATETGRQIDLALVHTYTQKADVQNFMSEEFVISSIDSVQVPNFTATGESAIRITQLEENPFDDGSAKVLRKSISVSFSDIPQETFQDMPEPFVIKFGLNPSDVQSLKEVDESRLAKYKVEPECVYWNFTANSWETSGCSLYNVDEINDYFSTDSLPETDITIDCACYHLTDFSVLFSQSSFVGLDQPGDLNFIFSESDIDKFLFTAWEKAIPLYILIGVLIFYFICMSFAYYWDNFNPHFSQDSIEVDNVYGYCDAQKVGAVLTQLEKQYIRNVLDKAKHQEDTSHFISRIVNSGLVNKLMKEGTIVPTPTDTSFARKRPSSLNDSGILAETPIKPPKFDLTGNQGTSVTAKINTFLATDDSNRSRRMMRFDDSLADIVTDPRDLSETIDQLKDRLYALDEDQDYISSVDKFLEKHDKAVIPDKLLDRLSLENRKLMKNDITALGYEPNDFNAISFTKRGPVANSKLLTGGRYGEQLVDDVKKFYYQLKVSYFSLVELFFKKEHKIFALFYNLHIEYNKKQMMTFLFMHVIINLFVITLYIAIFNWDTEKNFSASGLCTWGCNKEVPMFMGAAIVIVTWPFIYAIKFLFARNMVEYGTARPWKIQASRDKYCRESVGTNACLTLIIIIFIGTALTLVAMPYSYSDAIDFLYCVLGAFFWSFIVSEFLCCFVKAALVYMAVANEYSEPGKCTMFSRKLLTCFPCLLPTEL